MKILIANTYDNQGGAARAAFRLHKSLIACGLESRMRVSIKTTDFITIDGAKKNFGEAMGLARMFFERALLRFQKTNNMALHSLSVLPSGIVREINNSSADVVNLHWVCGEFLSIEDVGRIRKPLVWTLHDMWAFSGAEHYGTDDSEARWRQGYFSNNRPFGHKGLDIDRWVWKRKKRAWRHPIQIVTPSRWLASCVKDSFIMADWPVAVIPNALDCRQFQPWPKIIAREVLGLSPEETLVLYGAMGGASNYIKGWELLQPALSQLASEKYNIQCVIFGQSEPADSPNVGMPLHYVGHLSDDATLALLYSAADVMVAPSRQETLCQTATEAQACGCPVVAFNCTGLQDVVEHRVTGYLATPYNPADLASGIKWVTANKERHARLSSAARERALSLWAPEIIASRYKEIYDAVIYAGNQSSKKIKSLNK